MWVIQVTSNLNHQRDLHISQILDQPNQCSYLFKRSGNSKWSSTPIIQTADVWKTRSGAERIVNKFNQTDEISKSKWNNPFNWLRDSHLSIRKLTVEEWNLIIDWEISNLDRNYNEAKTKLSIKRSGYSG